MAALDDKPTIRVRGHGTVRAEPDQALLWITLTARADAPGPALADVSARSRTLVAMLDELQIREPDRTTTGVTVAEEIERLTNPEIIARLISRAAGELDARVDGPRWQIAPDNPVRLEAAREAARDAERTARAYAEGIGAELGRPLHLSEPEDWHGARAFTAAGGGSEHVSIDPGEHEVFASIEVTFALEPDGGRG